MRGGLSFFPKCVRIVAAIAVCTFFSANVTERVFANNKSTRAAQALLDRARQATNVKATGGEPFLLVATTSWTEHGETTNGQFALAWQAPDRYRREITLPGFFEAEVVAGNVLYRTRNTDFLPLAALRPTSLLEVSQAFANWPTRELKIDAKKLPAQLAGASDFQCISAVTEFPRSSVRHVACFDNQKGVPLIEQERLPNAESTVTFSNYASLNGKAFPREIRYDDSVGVHGAIEVVKFEPMTNFPEKTFERPAGSTEQVWCADPTVTPVERGLAMENWLRWQPGPILALDDPLVFVAVTAKGSAQKVELLDSSAGKLEKMAASRIWNGRFPVESCDKTAIPYETILHLMRMQPYE